MHGRSWFGLCLSAVLAGAAIFAGDQRSAHLRVEHAPPPQRAAAGQLPAGLAASVARASQQLIAAIAVDFDHDGDLDVVATDEALHLLVWVNDGTGHLTRRRPAHTTGWRTDPPLPSVDELPALSDAATQEDRPSLHADVNTSRAVLSYAGTLALAGGDRPAASSHTRLSSRAPPDTDS